MSSSHFNEEERKILYELHFNVPHIEKTCHSALYTVAIWGYLQTDSVSTLEKYMKRLIDLYNWSKYDEYATIIMIHMVDSRFPIRGIPHTEKIFRKYIETGVSVDFHRIFNVITSDTLVQKNNVKSLLEYVNDIGPLKNNMKHYLAHLRCIEPLFMLDAIIAVF